MNRLFIFVNRLIFLDTRCLARNIIYVMDSHRSWVEVFFADKIPKLEDQTVLVSCKRNILFHN